MASGNGPDPFDLERFIDAQREVYETALMELHRGRKESHWMWFIFPQLKGLGHSAMSQFYGIGGIDEARAYWRHPLLGQRLKECIRALLAHPGASIRAILGNIDALKLQSCLTLFQAAVSDGADKKLIKDALAQFYESRGDQRTLELLAGKPPV